MRKMIELAAKAAGIDGSWGHEAYIEKSEGFIPRGSRRAWDPTRNYEDAFRLMVKLRLAVSIEAPDNYVVVVTEDAEDFVERGDDLNKTTMLAITKVAAFIGEKMP